MQNNDYEKKINMYDREEVRELCGILNCTPYDLYVAYRKVGDSLNEVKVYIKKEYSKNFERSIYRNV
jgi:hypothetical protein